MAQHILIITQLLIHADKKFKHILLKILNKHNRTSALAALASASVSLVSCNYKGQYIIDRITVYWWPPVTPPYNNCISTTCTMGRDLVDLVYIPQVRQQQDLAP